MSQLIVCTRTFGYKTTYAPITPLIAPLAPTIGTELDGSITICAAAAAAPLTK